MTFDEAFNLVLMHEGGYSDHPADPGGRTMYGITEAVARAYGYTGEMKNLPVDVAKDIYRRQYWLPLRCEELPDGIRLAHFDAGVNSGLVQATLWLQRAAGVTTDGHIGPQTIAACYAVSDGTLLRKMLGHRLEFMTRLKVWPHFSAGWARRIASLMRG